MACSNRTLTGEFTDEGVRERNHEESPELATDQGQKQLCKLPCEEKCPADGHTSPRQFPGGNRDISTLTSLLSQICAQSTPQSKPTWDWGPQKICCRCGPRQASLPGNEKGGGGQQSPSTAMHMLIHTREQKNEQK